MSHKREREKPPESISWRIHERDMCRLSRAYKSAVTALVLALVLAMAFAVYESYLRHAEQKKWLDYLDQYDFESYDYTQDGQGLNIIGDGNGVDYNVPTSESSQADEKEPRNSQGQSAEEGEEMSREGKPEDEV